MTGQGLSADPELVEQHPVLVAVLVVPYAGGDKVERVRRDEGDLHGLVGDVAVGLRP